MPIYEHPISIRLTSKVAALSPQWTNANGGAWAGTVSPLSSGFSGQPGGNTGLLPNPMIDPKAFADPTNANPEIGVTYFAEFQIANTNALRGGGAFVTGSGTVQNYPMDGKSGAKTFSILSQLNAFKTLGTTLNGTTAFNLIIHGQNDAVFGQTGPSGGQTYFEYSSVTGNSDAGFSRDFYKQGSSYVLFNSNDDQSAIAISRNNYSPQSPLTTGLFGAGWRKDFAYNFIGRFDQNQLIGIDMRGTTAGSELFIEGLPGFDWNTVAGLSANALCSINSIGYAQTMYGYFEGGTATRIGSVPNILTAGQFSTPFYLYIFTGITTGSYGTSAARFILSGAGAGLPFVNSGILTAGKVVFNQIQDNATPYDPSGNRWVITPGTSLTIRSYNHWSVGNKNLYCGDANSLSTRMLSLQAGVSAPTQNINTGDYVQFIPGSGLTSANLGVYRVINTYYGIPGDIASTREVTQSGQTMPVASRFESVELSRGTTVDSFASTNSTSPSAIRKILGPVLHIKYT